MADMHCDSIRNMELVLPEMRKFFSGSDAVAIAPKTLTFLVESLETLTKEVKALRSDLDSGAKF